MNTRFVWPTLFGVATAAAVGALATHTGWDVGATLFTAVAAHVLMAAIAGGLHAIDRYAAH